MTKTVNKLILAVLFILIGCIIGLRQMHENKVARDSAEAVAAQFREFRSETSGSDFITSEIPSPAASGEPLDPIVRIGDFDYIGTLILPKLWLELPVMSSFDDGRIDIGPCRQFGSAVGGNLVIAAHNHPANFGNLSQLKPGDKLSFIDSADTEYSYEVSDWLIIDSDDIEIVRNSGYPLTLYTCTESGNKRYVVFCNLTKE